jgi:hypothetical protein
MTIPDFFRSCLRYQLHENARFSFRYTHSHVHIVDKILLSSQFRYVLHVRSAMTDEQTSDPHALYL